MCLRILKLHDSRKACMYLSCFESFFGQWHSKNCKEPNKFSFEQFAAASLPSETNTVSVDVTAYLTRNYGTERLPKCEVPESKVQIGQLIES